MSTKPRTPRHSPAGRVVGGTAPTSRYPSPPSDIHVPGVSAGQQPGAFGEGSLWLAKIRGVGAGGGGVVYPRVGARGWSGSPRSDTVSSVDGMGAGAPATDDRGLPLRGVPWR